MGRRARAWRTASIALVVVGSSALFWSTQQDRIWWALAGFLVGMTSLSLLLLRVGDAIDDWLLVRQPWWVPWLAGGAAAGGFAAVVVVISRQLPPAAVIAAMIAMTVGIIGLFQWFDRPRGAAAAVDPANGDRVEGSPSDPGRIGVGSATWYGFEAMAVATGLYLIADGPTTLIGAVVWLTGLVAVKIGSIGYFETRGAELGRTVRVLVDVALLGIFVLFAGAFGSSTVLLLVGLSVATAALSMLGVAAPHLADAHRFRWWAIGGSLALMVVVWAWMAVVTQNPGLAFVLGLMIALVGGFFVLRGEGIVLLMLAAYILAWGLVDRSVAVAESVPTVTGKPVQIVALGDSFISGEGALEFLEGTNEAGGNQCRRAPTSYPFLIARGLETNVLSLACSGAKIADLTACGQMWPNGRRCRLIAEPAPVSGDGAGDGPDAPNPLLAVWSDAIDDDAARPPGALPQLVTAMARDAPAEADVVLLSIGGNDVGFSSIVKACLLPKGCEERRELWLDAIELLGPQLDDVYAEVRRVFPDAEVLVMPYPNLVNAEPGTSCDLGLSQEEREFVVGFVEQLDLTVADAAGRAGFVVVEAAITAFENERALLCDETAAANHLKLVPPAGDALGRYSPGTWIPGSMHPNVLGHELTATAAVCPTATALGVTPVDGVIADRPFSCSDESAFPGTGEADGSEGPDGGVDGGADTTAACEEALGADGSAGADQDEAAACVAVAEVVDDRLDELAAEVAVVTEELVSDDEWIRIELFRTVRALALPLVLLLAAGMIFAWGFAQLNNPFSRFLSQEHRR